MPLREGLCEGVPWPDGVTVELCVTLPLPLRVSLGVVPWLWLWVSLGVALGDTA